MDTPTRSTYITGPEEWLSMNHDTLQRISEEMYASVDNSEKGLRITGQQRVKLTIRVGHKIEERFSQCAGVQHKIKTEMNNWVVT